MSGMDMMMKAMGFDPNDIKKQIAEAGNNFNIIQKNFNDKLDLIIANQNIIASSLHINLKAFEDAATNGNSEVH